MKQSKRKGFFSTITSGPVTDSLGIVVHGLCPPVTNVEVDPGKDALFVSSEHPGKFFHRFETTVSGPLEPLVEKSLCPPFSLIGPELFKEFLKQISPVDLQVQPFQSTQSGSLFVSEVLGVLEPDIAGSCQEVRIGLPEGSSLGLANTVDSLQKMPYDMELVKDHNGIGKHLVNHIDIGCPHIATYSLDTAAPVLSHFLEETAESVSITAFCTPQEPFSVQVIDLGMVDMTTTATDLGDPYKQDIINIPAGKSIGYRCLDSRSHRVPADSEQTGHHIPCQQPRPCGKHHNQRLRQRTFALSPRDGFNLDATIRTVYPRRSILDRYGDSPQWYMSPFPLPQSVSHLGSLTALSTGKSPASYPVHIDLYLAHALLYSYYTMILESKCVSYYTIHKHVSLLQVLSVFENPQKYLKGHVLFNSYCSFFSTDSREEPETLTA